MFDIIALFVGIYLLVQLTRLRAALSFAFPRVRAHHDTDATAPQGAVERYASADVELRRLGFDGPHWFLQEHPELADEPATPVAAYHQALSQDIVWLHPVAALNRPHDLIVYFVRHLRDGRIATSQVLDPYSALLADARTPAQTLGAGSLEELWKAHAHWCDSLGEADTTTTLQARLDFQAAEFHNQRRQSLLDRGLVYVDRRGLARPRLRFGLQMLSAMRRLPKPVANAEPVSPARMVLLAQAAQRIAMRTVPLRVQAGLFGVSVILFLILGGIFWGLRFSMILLLVVAIHELGHFLAMRAFGYRNVQMLTLPLVGGVTIGHELHPDAGRRAWTSLMGPLPGIVIGWCLLVPAYTMISDPVFAAWLREAAWVFLAVNYLNVLPVPPLDGAHVVQAMLPVRAARLSAWFIGVASIVGAALAAWVGVYLLAALALIQLIGARTRWQLANVLDRLHNDPRLDTALPKAQRELRVFEVFDEVAGTTPHAAGRLGLAAEALRSVDLKPMRPLQRGVIGAIYAVLLAVPLAGVVLAVMFLREMPASAIAPQRTQDEPKHQASLRAQAQQMDLRALLVGRQTTHDAAAGLAAPATEADLASAQQRLGLHLPAELIEVYRVADGVASIPLLPLTQLRRAADVAELDISTYAIQGEITFWTDEAASSRNAEPVPVTPQQAGRWLMLGNDMDLGTALLYDAEEPPLRASQRLYVLESEASHATTGLRRWLESRWVNDALSTEYAQALERIKIQQRSAIAQLGLVQLLAEFERPAWWKRQLYPQLDWPQAATAATIEATMTRLGRALPADLAQIYALHDGFPPLGLLDLRTLQPFSALDADLQRSLREFHSTSSSAPTHHPVAAVASFDPGPIDDCIAISGGGHDRLRWVTQFWCPTHAPAQQYVDTILRQTYPSYTEIVRERVASQRAARVASQSSNPEH